MSVTKKIGSKAIRLAIGDITETDADAFIYDITSDVQLGSGYGGAIATRGGKKVQQELDEVGSCPTGQAVITSAGKLKAKHIIFVNGPKFLEEDEEGKLRRATEAALKLAEKHQVRRLAFPPVGTGLYQVDLGLCARVMVDAVAKHLQGKSGLKEVLFVALDDREYQPLKARIQGDA